VLVGWRVARSRAGFFPVRAAFPVSVAGRRPHHYFRGLLKLHTRYGLQGCSPTYVGFIARLRPSRFPGSDARKLPSSTNNLLGWVLPPLVICAVEVHPITPDNALRHPTARRLGESLSGLATTQPSDPLIYDNGGLHRKPSRQCHAVTRKMIGSPEPCVR